MTNSPSARRPIYARPLTWIISAAVVIVLVIGAIVGTKIYVSAQNDTAPDAFGSTASATEEPSGSGTSADEGAAGEGSAGEIAGEWEISDGSEAGYRVAEVLNGDDVTVVGRTDDVTGSVTIEGTTLTAGEVKVDLSTVATDNDRRDSYFTSTAIDTNSHPDATFTSEESIDLAALADSGSAEVELPGTLTINGQSQDATATVTATRTDDGLTVTGSIDATWADYGVEAPDLGFVSVEDSGVVEFSLTLTQQ